MAYVGAPYNFSSLPEKPLVREKDEIPALNKLNDRLYSGEIAYTAEAKTDIIVGDVTGSNFYKNIDGTYAIKGSSLRGLFRSNMQILGLGSIADDVSGDYSMMYRKVGSVASDLKKTYETTLGTGIYRATEEEGGGTISIRKNVKAGILFHDNDNTYYIYPSAMGPINKREKGEQNYFVLRENAIIGALQRPKDSYRYKYLTNAGMNVLMYDHTGAYPFGEKGYTNRDAFNPHYRPSFKEIAFHLGLHEKIDQVAAPGHKLDAGWYHGYLVSTGYMSKKKAHYIVEGDFNNLNGSARFKVNPEAVRAYEADYESRKNLFGTTQSTRGLSNGEKAEVKEASQQYYKLPAKGEYKPVFYIDGYTNGHVYFGFTPNLRLYFDHTIQDGIPAAHKNVKNDYVKTIMGYSIQGKDKKGKSEADSRKTRVSVSDAVLVSKDKHPEGKLQSFVPGGPKPTSFYDYLEQASDHVFTYNDSNKSGMTIRGYKQYWLHKEVKAAPAGTGNTNVSNSFTPLKAGAVFKGTVRFNNLSEDELGLLLWCIRLEKGCEQNIGKAKAYGYGRIAFHIDNLRLFDLEKLYLSPALDFSPFTDSDKNTENEVDKFIRAYKEKASSTEMLGSDIMANRSVARFLLMKNAENFVDESEMEYMKLQPDYADREKEPDFKKRALPYPEKIQKKIPAGLQPAFSFVPASKSNRSGNGNQNTGNKANGFKEGDIVTGIVNNYLTKGTVKNGVFLTLPGLKKGLLHESKAARKPAEYAFQEKVQVKVLEYSTTGGKTKISLTDIDVPQA